MLGLLLGYIGGVIYTAMMLRHDVIDTSDKREMVKSGLVVLGISLFWPIFGAWILWEFLDVWRICSRTNSTFKKESK